MIITHPPGGTPVPPSSPIPTRRAQADLRTVDDFEMGDYVVCLDHAEATRRVFRIEAISDKGLLLERYNLTAQPAARWDWASEDAIDAALRDGTVSS